MKVRKEGEECRKTGKKGGIEGRDAEERKKVWHRRKEQSNVIENRREEGKVGIRGR